MRTRDVVITAAVAGLLGVAVSLAVDPGGFGRSRLGRMFGDDGAVPERVRGRLQDVELPDPDGRPRRLASLIGGRPALLNFWASWCAPCLREMPALDAFSREQAANGVQVIGIALDDPVAVRAFLRRRPVRYPILVDTPGPADLGARLGNARGVLPFSVLVAADGTILRRRAGPLEARDLADWADATRTRD